MGKNLPSLPTVILDGEEGAWETLVTIITRRLLPQLETVGISIFRPSPQPLPPDAKMIPFHDIWTRSRPYPERFPQLAYVIAGQGEMILGEHWLSLSAGQGIFIPSGVPHAPHAMRGDQIKVSDWLRILIYPFGVIVHRCRLTPMAHEKSVRYFVPNPTLSELFQAWRQGLPKSQPFEAPSPLRDKNILGAFFCLLTESRPVPVNPMEQIPKRVDELPPILHRAVLLLHSGFNRPFRLSTLAKQCFVSPYYLCHLFRRYLGVSPLGYLTRLRLAIARQLLEQTELRVGDVAALVGYNDWRHFHRLFVRHFGIPPSALQRRHQKLHYRVFKPPL